MNIDESTMLHRETFKKVYQLTRVHYFGRRDQGIDDDIKGVQWNAWADWSDSGHFTGCVGVNIEGITYDNWPIDRLIERELGRFSLFRLFGSVDNPEKITVRWTRDVWANDVNRLELQSFLCVPMSALTEDRGKWRNALDEAQGCLNRLNEKRKRARRLTTVKGVTKEREVSPHLQMIRELWRDELPSPAELEERMRRARRQLDPLYNEMLDLSKRIKITPAQARLDIEAMEAEEKRYVEGEMSRVLVRHYERDPGLRAKAIEIHGTSCQGCGFSFEKVYGDHGAGYIEVHHRRPIASYGGSRPVDPHEDMAVLCSNCHRMVHRHPSGPLSLDEPRDILRK